MVRGRMNHCAVTVTILYPARITASNAVNVKHRKLVDCNAIQRSTIKHRKSPQNRNQYRCSLPRTRTGLSGPFVFFAPRLIFVETIGDVLGHT